MKSAQIIFYSVRKFNDFNLFNRVCCTMNSNKKEEEKLPDGWKQFKSKSNPGRNYYFNMKTGKSLWTQPKVFSLINLSNKLRVTVDITLSKYYSFLGCV